MEQHTPTLTADPTAIIGRRIVAWLIDFLIIATILVVIALATFTNTSFGSSLAAELQCDIINDTSDDLCISAGSTVYVGQSDTLGVMLIVTFVYALVVTILIPGFAGWSPGKLMMGLRVVNNQSFELAGMGPNIGRGFFWVVDSFPWFVPFVGFVVGVASKGHRRVGDMVANTLVVDKSLVGHPMAVAGVNDLPAIAGDQPPPPTTGLPPAPPFAQPPLSQPAAPGPQSAAPPPFPPIPAPTSATDPIAAEPEPTPATDPIAAEPPPPPTPPAPTPPAPTPPAPTPAPPQPGIDAPQWDSARNTYIQWDPQLNEWMEWDEVDANWIPISR